METYANNNGNSSVGRYQIGGTYIVVEFKADKYSGPMYYRYTYELVGQNVIEEMKRLARHGSGLSSYINTKPPVPWTTKGTSLESV